MNAVDHEPQQPIQKTSSSIFGAGKPRDINNPEIRKLEERLEKTLAINYAAPLAATSQAGQ